MQLRHVPTWVLLAALGCGPSAGAEPDPASESWMQGWFTTLQPRLRNGAEGSEQFELRPDGTGTHEYDSLCQEFYAKEFTWSPLSEDLVELRGESLVPLVLRRLGSCEFEQQVLRNGEIRGVPEAMFRGRLCDTGFTPAEEGCHATSCRSCYRDWCEGDEPLDCPAPE